MKIYLPLIILNVNIQSCGLNTVPNYGTLLGVTATKQ